MARFFALLAFTAGVASCALHPSRSNSSSSADDACGQPSPLGQAVANAAGNGPSTVPRVVSPNNTVVGAPIVGGEAFADAVAQLVGSATEEVILESFILADGWIASRARDAIQALDPSIPVYVLVTTDTERVDDDTQKTAAAVQAILDPDSSHNVIVAAWKPGGFLVHRQIDHDKLLVVDRARVLVSNINKELSADPTWYGPKAHSWYQLGQILDGDIANVAALEAASAWAHATGWASSNGGTQPQAFPSWTGTPSSGCVPIVALGREAATHEQSSADQGFQAFFTSATNVLRVQTPNLNDGGALAALVSATNNADVRVVLSKGFGGFAETLWGEGGSNVDVVGGKLPDALNSSGNACQMHVRWYASPVQPGVPVEGTDVDGASHAKVATADSQVVVIGSQNLDTQSWKSSREFSVAIDDAPTAQAYEAEFDAVWNRSVCAFECGGCD